MEWYHIIILIMCLFGIGAIGIWILLTLIYMGDPVLWAKIRNWARDYDKNHRNNNANS